jgi:hypothetical protein
MTQGCHDVANFYAAVLWPMDFALKELPAAAEEELATLLMKAVS